MRIELAQSNGDSESSIEAWIYIGHLIIFALLAESKNAFIGLLAALITFLGMHILAALDNPLVLFAGILYKVPITYFLIVGIIAAKEYSRGIKKLKTYNITFKGNRTELNH